MNAAKYAIQSNGWSNPAFSRICSGQYDFTEDSIPKTDMCTQSPYQSTI